MISHGWPHLPSLLTRRSWSTHYIRPWGYSRQQDTVPFQGYLHLGWETDSFSIAYCDMCPSGGKPREAWQSIGGTPEFPPSNLQSLTRHWKKQREQLVQTRNCRMAKNRVEGRRGKWTQGKGQMMIVLFPTSTFSLRSYMNFYLSLTENYWKILSMEVTCLPLHLHLWLSSYPSELFCSLEPHTSSMGQNFLLACLSTLLPIFNSLTNPPWGFVSDVIASSKFSVAPWSDMDFLGPWGIFPHSSYHSIL